MKNVKSKLVLFIITVCVIGSIVLIFLNFSYFESYQIKYRNELRTKDIDNLSDGIKKFINDKNNCPRTSNPVPQTFLPELVFDGSSNPRGGVNISTLEDMNGFIDLYKKDPSGSPYLVGTFDNKIYIYTSNFEVYNSSNTTYFKSIETSLCNQIPS